MEHEPETIELTLQLEGPTDEVLLRQLNEYTARLTIQDRLAHESGDWLNLLT